MGALLLTLDMIVQQGESIVVRRYGKKHGIGGLFFNSIICLFALIFFIITDKNGLCFPPALIAYGLVSCIMYATGFYTMYAALRTGSFIATKLIASLSGIISIAYGILFLKEPATIFTYMAITLFFISMFMVNYQKTEESEKKTFSVKWLIYVLLTAISNGFIGVISRAQQLCFDSAYDNEFMLLSFGGAFIFLMIFSFVNERKNFIYILRHGTIYGLIAGIMNGAKNFINLALYLYIPISILTPLRTGIGFILSFLLSVFLYKERFTKLQVAGVILGIISLVMFKL